MHKCAARAIYHARVGDVRVLLCERDRPPPFHQTAEDKGHGDPSHASVCAEPWAAMEERWAQ